MTVVIFDGENGRAHVLIPTEESLARLPADWTDEQKIIWVANRDLAPGTEFELVDPADLPADRTYRNAWRFEAGPGVRTAAENPPLPTEDA